MSQRTRAYRRAQRSRIQRYRATYCEAGYYYRPQHSRIDARTLGRITRTTAACSCWMCNRPRQVFGVPFADHRRLLRHTGGE